MQWIAQAMFREVSLKGHAKSIYDGRSALDFVGQEGLPHPAVVDIPLPDVDGLELAKWMERQGWFGKLV